MDHARWMQAARRVLAVTAGEWGLTRPTVGPDVRAVARCGRAADVVPEARSDVQPPLNPAPWLTLTACADGGARVPPELTPGRSR